MSKNMWPISFNNLSVIKSLYYQRKCDFTQLYNEDVRESDDEIRTISINRYRHIKPSDFTTSIYLDNSIFRKLCGRKSGKSSNMSAKKIIALYYYIQNNITEITRYITNQDLMILPLPVFNIDVSIAQDYDLVGIFNIKVMSLFNINQKATLNVIDFDCDFMKNELRSIFLICALCMELVCNINNIKKPGVFIENLKPSFELFDRYRNVKYLAQILEFMIQNVCAEEYDILKLLRAINKEPEYNIKIDDKNLPEKLFNTILERFDDLDTTIVKKDIMRTVYSAKFMYILAYGKIPNKTQEDSISNCSSTPRSLASPTPIQEIKNEEALDLDFLTTSWNNTNIINNENIGAAVDAIINDATNEEKESEEEEQHHHASAISALMQMSQDKKNKMTTTTTSSTSSSICEESNNNYFPPNLDMENSLFYNKYLQFEVGTLVPSDNTRLFSFVNIS